MRDNNIYFNVVSQKQMHAYQGLTPVGVQLIYKLMFGFYTLFHHSLGFVAWQTWAPFRNFFFVDL